MHCSRQSSNRDIYVVPVKGPVYHLNTGIEEPININISLNFKPEKYVIVTIIRIIINYLIFKIIPLLCTKIYYRVNRNATSTLGC